MEKTLLRIITLDKICFEKEVKMAIFDVADGQVGVLPGHAPLTIGLKEGEGSIRAINDDEEIVFTLNGGFAKISADSIVILTESAYENINS